MNKITFPLKLRMKRPEIGDLQDVLQLLLERGALLATDDVARRKLSEMLRREHASQRYGKATRQLVSIFQEERKLQPSGEVDELTANALNSLLRELGLHEGKRKPSYQIVSGAIQREDGRPLQGMRVRADHEVKQRSIRLGEDTTDHAGRYTIRYALLPGVDAIQLRVSAIDESGRPLQSSDVVRNANPLEIIDLVIPMTQKPIARQRIEGTIVLEQGVPADKLKLRLYQCGFGGKAELLSETQTLAGGAYAFDYEPVDRALSLEVRAVNAANEEIPLSKPLNDLSREPRAVLNLAAPATLRPLAAEYTHLAEDLKPHIGQMAKLAGAKENDERQDLTVLNRATGWDARLIALAAISERVSADPEVKLPQEAMYGLLRAGLPSDKLLLAQVEPGVAEQALKTVRDAGIVALTDAQISLFKREFTRFGNGVRLNIPVPGSRSTYGELLKTSGLPKAARDKFVPIFLNHRGNAAQLWDKAREAGLDDAQVGRLQLQGKFAFLAGNSAAMTDRLLKKAIDDPARLVAQDLHRADAWATEVFEQAGIPANRRSNLNDADRQKLDELIPSAYAAHEVEDRLHAYSEDMARKLRLSYPTQVIGRLMESDDTFKLSAAHEATLTLLNKAAVQGFRLGETPVSAFLDSHPELMAGMADADAHPARQQLQTLQRVYQITPNNEAMPVLISLGMTSAYDVMSYPEAAFTTLFETRYREIYDRSTPSGLARMVSSKSNQVSSVTYNLFTMANQLDSEPPVAGLSAPMEVRESVRNELIKHFPTMESLFGSLDFCECEHCRSVLSPAAYLVDLLQFVDPDPEVWVNFLTLWKAHHNDQDYPHKDVDGNPMTPYDVLVARRPDLLQLPLTCENTHTALPYIDIVNEVLEYYVAHGKLEEKAAQDTGEATTAELLAEPQNVIREAYDKLREARYPLNLPFDLSVETVRRFCNYFETPLDRVLETFRESDELFVPTQAFDRASVFMESLGLSPAEVAIFTDPDPLANWHELYGFNTAALATTEASDPTTGQRLDLNSAKALSHRLGVTYKEIAEIVQTGFVNPRLPELVLLYKLGVTIQDARFYKDHKPFYEQNEDLVDKDRDDLSLADQQRFDDLSNTLLDTQRTGWEIVNEVAAFQRRIEDLATAFNTPPEDELQTIPFDEILVLADPDAGCNFDLTTLRYTDGTEAAPMDFLRINLFVRLWRKLGWNIEETDRALNAFIPESAPFDGTPANLAKQPLKTALVYLAHLDTLDGKLRVGKQSRLDLLTLWSDMATTGKQPLYARLFLTRGVLENAPVFDHPLGKYLNDSTVGLEDHLLAVQGALGLTADEVGRILVDSGKSLDSAALSLPNISLLYRYGMLAKALKLSVGELIALKQLSGLNPFTPLDPDPLAMIEADYPFTQTLRFVEIAETVKNSGLKIEDLDYLLRHRFDKTGKYRPDDAGSLALLKTLAEGIRTIRVEHAVPDEPGLLSEEVLRQKLGLVLSPDVAERLLAMVNGTAEFTATTQDVIAVNQLTLQGLSGDPSILEVSYKETRQQQKLTFKGVLFDDQRIDLQSRFDGQLTIQQKPVFAGLLGGVQALARAFFDNQLRKQKLRVDGDAGFLDDSDFETLFQPLKPLTKILPTDTSQQVDDKLRENEDIQRQNQEVLQQRYHRIANVFLPYLQQRLIRQFIVGILTAHTGAEPALVASLVTDNRLLALAAPNPLLVAIAATGERGVDAVFFDSEDLSGEPQATRSVVRNVDMALSDTLDAAGNPPTPAGSARFEGYLEAPAEGAYRFYIELEKPGAKAELRFAHLSVPTLGDQADEFVELKPGIPYRFSLELRNLAGGGARLLVQGETLPKDVVSQLRLYSLSAVDATDSAILLLTKALQLVQGLDLGEREIRYLLTHPDDFGGVSLSQLPIRRVGVTAGDKEATRNWFTRFLRLAAYARLKRDLSGGSDDLIDIFEANSSGSLNTVYPLIAGLTRRDEAMVEAAANALVAAPTLPAFESEEPLLRLWEALQVVERFGVPVASLQGWTHITSPAATPVQRFEIARDLKEAIRARFDPDAWQRVAQPIFDQLRQRQRDALVSHVMHQHGFDRLEQLYEYFLIDLGMEPVVQTSRIRLAIGSLQLFIQRCLLNLESNVQPSTINSKQWEWMKRYRVWEANRKIFLWPQNWLEPEFRDDKTHLFDELEGALLQGDVSSDLVEDAFLNYLKKLDELARLDIVAMHIENEPDPARRTLHVFGRTYSQPHKYFYRRYAHQMWTPWEPVSAEIEGDHLAPVVWRDRLYLFWVTFMDKPLVNSGPDVEANSPKLVDASVSDLVGGVQGAGAKKQIDIQLHWSEYLQGEWSTRQSSGFSQVMTRVRVPKECRFISSGGSVPLVVPLTFNPTDVFIHVSKEPYENGAEGGIFIHLEGSERFKHNFYLAGRNSLPESSNVNVNGPEGEKPENPYSSGVVRSNRYSGNRAFSVVFQETITTGAETTSETMAPAILRKSAFYTLLPCDNQLTALGVSDEAFQGAADPDAVEAAIESGLAEIASLMKPVFYQDNRHTLFVEPSVTEKTIEEGQEWVTPTPQPDPDWREPAWWNDLAAIAKVPKTRPGSDPTDRDFSIEIDGSSLIKPSLDHDWLLNPATALQFDGVLLGPTGQPGLKIQAGEEDETVASVGVRMNVNRGSGLALGSAVTITDTTMFERSGLIHADGGLNVIGNAGFNSALEKNFRESKCKGLDVKIGGAGRAII